MKISYAPLAIACLALGACMTPVPVSTSYPLTYQRQMLAVHHWEVMAVDVANWLQGLLMGSSEQGQGQNRDNSLISLSIQPSRYGSEIGEVFHGLLVTQLVNRGFIISMNPAEGFPVNYDIRVVTEPVMLTETGNVEVILTASLMNGDRYLGRFSDIYYIPEKNASLYIAKGPAPITTRMIEVVGP